MVRSRYRPLSPFQIGDFIPDSVRASSHKVPIPLYRCCPVYFSGVDFYQVEQALCPSAYIIYYYVIQMPGTLRLILNLFDDLLDNFFSFFSLFKQVHSSSFKIIQVQIESKKVREVRGHLKYISCRQMLLSICVSYLSQGLLSSQI